MERQVPTVDVRKVMEAMKETKLPPGRKYRKLAHLNRSEKALRRKLMSKMHSKLSRDRKRGEVEGLKETIEEMRVQLKQLKVSRILLLQI